MRVIISGGGTGGHVFPAIAIADALSAKLKDVKLLFVGAQDKLEERKVPEAGYCIETLWISGFQRKLTLRNLLFPFKLAWSLLRCLLILRRFRPDVAVGVGGYASGPLLQMASWMSIPILIQEQNSYPGITNRLLANRADAVCVAYDHMDKFFPNDKIIKTGNPIRKVFTDGKTMTAKAAKEKLGFDADKDLVLVIGGSLGALALNKAMRDNHQHIIKNNNIQWLWQAGKTYISEYSICKSAKEPQVQIKEFINAMDVALLAADIVIARAGALSISELEYMGKASILVPSPNVAEDHQTKNAQALVDDDAALIVNDRDASDQLVLAAINLLSDRSRIKSMEQKIRQRSVSNAADRIADEVIKLSKL